MTFTQTASFDSSDAIRVPSVMDYVHDLSTLTDEQLLTQSLKSPSAFEVLVTRHQKDFLERATYVVKSRDEAEDVVQDTFVRIYRFAPRFNESYGTFRSWAMTILMNVARTKLQKRTRDWLRTTQLEPEHYESLAAPSEEDAMLAKDTVTRVLARAPEDTAHLLRLVYLEGLSYEQIGERESITVGAVKTRVHRAKKVLQKLIQDLDI